jgi:hypothetical protein
MTNGGQICNEVFMIVADGTVNMDIFGNITGRNGSSINEFDGFCGF